MQFVNEYKLILEPIWWWPLVAAAILVVLTTILTTYRSRLEHLPPRSRRLLLGLRLAAAAFLVLAMLRPAIQLRESDRKTPVLAVIADATRSMSTPDGPGGVTRREAILRTVDECKPQLEEIQEDVEIRYYDFAEELTPVENLTEQTDGRQTAIGAALDSLLEENRDDRLVAAVLLSDGAQRAVPPFDADPRAKARLLGQQRVPVYTIPFGGSGLSGTAFDLAAEDLLVDPLVFEKKTVPVSAKVRVLGAAGRALTVRLLVEDRTGKKRGEAGEMVVPPAGKNANPSTQVRPATNAEVIPVELSYVPQRPGEFKLAMEIVPLEGELKQQNNRQETIISVQEGGINIAYFDSPRPEQKWINAVNSSDKIQLDRYIPATSRSDSLVEIDPAVFDPGKYDAYIIGDVPAKVFGRELLRRLAARIDEGAGLLLTGGVKSFGAGGYADTPLVNYVPVELRASEFQPNDEIAESLHHLGQLKMLPTTVGLNRFVMRLDSPDRNRELWRELPMLNGANRLTKKRGGLVEVWAETPGGDPLLLAHEIGQARVAAFAGDTTWRWYMGGFREAHQRFWRQMILWLSRKEAEGDQPVWVRVDPRNFAPAQRVDLAFGARTEDGKPIADADFSVEVITPDGERQQLTPRSSGSESSATVSQTQQPGDYWVRVSASRDGQQVGFDAWTRFIVDARDRELDNPAADPLLLEEIAALTGGSSMPPEQLGSFLTRQLEEYGFANADITRFRRINLWDNWGFLLLFVALMTAEWFFRKRRGLV